MSVEQKFARQIQLPEVGIAGQAAIGDSALMLNSQADSASSEFARLYGNAAGLSGAQVIGAPPLPAELLQAFRHSSSRAVGLGASFALSTILKALRDLSTVHDSATLPDSDTATIADTANPLDTAPASFTACPPLDSSDNK